MTQGPKTFGLDGFQTAYNSEKTTVIGVNSAVEVNKTEYLQTRLALLKVAPKAESSPVKKSRRPRRFRMIDYSLSIILLFVSTIFGFNLALQIGYRNGLATNSSGEVAGVTEAIEREIPIYDTNANEFSLWLDTNYAQEVEETESSELTEPSNTPDPNTLNVQELFGVSTINELDELQLSTDDYRSEVELYEQKIKTIELSGKVDEYIKSFRSYEEFDNQIATPLTGLQYLSVAQETGIPLKYLMAIARSESRFGTDRFTASGNLTRPGEHRNPCSIGLNDRGDNITFATWEEGLMACGRWYQYFEEKGVSDCRKWGIFNPNGDYCSKIEGLAAEIQNYLGNPEI